MLVKTVLSASSPSWLCHLASVGGCLKRLNSFAEGDPFHFYPQIIPKSLFLFALTVVTGWNVSCKSVALGI